MATKNVVLGTGHLGAAVVRQLQAKGESITTVNRFGRKRFEGVEAVPSDLNNSEDVAKACDGAEAVYHCAMPPYHRWASDFERLQAGIIGGVSKTGATLVWGDNMYAYGRVTGPRTETTPEDAQSVKGKVRKQLAEQLLGAHQSGDLKAAISRAADFYGPSAGQSTAGDYLFKRVLEGKSAQWLGDPDAPHSFTYINDFASSMISLAGAGDSLGQVWHAPTLSGISARDMVSEIARQAEAEAKVSVPPKFILRIMGLFSAPLRETFEMEYERTEPFLVDSSKFQERFGVEATSLKKGVEKTISWYRANAA